MSNWYPGANAQYPGNNAGNFIGGYAKKGVLHTTEGTSVAGAVGAYTNNNSWPHFTIHTDGTVYQHIPINKAARALQNLSGGVETNRGGAIQIEVVGFASNPNWPQVQKNALRFLMRWIESKTGIQTYGPAFGSGEQYGYNNPLEFSGGYWQSFNGWCGHQHVPENCVHIDTPILTASLDWIRAGDLVVGDELFGFEEEAAEIGSTAGRRFKRSTVEFTNRFEAEGYKVITSQGSLITTANHPWLVKDVTQKHGKRVKWVNSEDLNPAIHEVYFACEPWEVETSHTAGWLAGVLDADGHAQNNRDSGAWVGFGQVHGPLLDEFIFEMESRNFTIKNYERGADRGFGGKKPFTDVRVTGGLWEQLRVLGTLKPKRLSLDKTWDGAVVGKTCQRVQILSVERVGIQTFAGLQTSSKTYIANGFLSHNSHWDPGAINIYEFFPVEPEEETMAFSVPRAQGGYMVVQSVDGGVFSYEGAPFHGSLGGIQLNDPIVGAAWTQSGNGYWLLGKDGGIFSFGDAQYFGNPIPHLEGRIPVGIIAKGNGYRVVAFDPSGDGSPYDGYEFGT